MISIPRLSLSMLSFKMMVGALDLIQGGSILCLSLRILDSVRFELDGNVRCSSMLKMVFGFIC